MKCRYSDDCFKCPLSDCKMSTHLSIVNVNPLPYDKEYQKEIKREYMKQKRIEA